ncbi:MAG TPA: hypothetical protein VML75_17030 [Kofleriaceae bacterium]|nr:hypothetical protein [Kofleriaceae bacterium]
MPRASSAALALALMIAAPAAAQPKAGKKADSAADQTITAYFEAMERAGLIDVDSGSRDTLKKELDAAEKLLRDGNAVEASVALYGIVESPRYTAFSDFIEYHNAEYYLAVALATAGASDSALQYLVRVMERGPSTLYFAPAHRRAVDIAIETRRYREVLDLLTGLRLSEPIPPGPSGELAYLRARIAYDARDFNAAEAELTRISRKSRLYSSALYTRGIIRTRKGELRGAAEAMCEIVDTPDTDKYTFVVDDRYFTIKDLARLGLGRLAHEKGEYDDAYYHYFQIPDDSDRLPEALFEAAWSMYQKRELATARDLTTEFLTTFRSSHLVPETELLRGFVDLADCEFDAAQQHYDRLVAQLGPVVAEMDRIRKSPAQRRELFERAIDLRRAERADPHRRAGFRAKDRTDQVLALLRVDPAFVRIHQSIAGLRRASGDAPHVVRAWSGLARNMKKTAVGVVKAERTVEEEDAADANSLLEDVRRLQDELFRARAELQRGVREKTLPRDVAADEQQRLDGLSREIDRLEVSARAAAVAADGLVTGGSTGDLGPMVKADLTRARALDQASRALLRDLTRAADDQAKRALDKLYTDTKRVLDKARLGKIDAVIGQKRRLDIEVSDLSSGRYPAELHGRLWEQGLIGDDEEFWPFEGEYWADEYEGWR